MALEKTRIAASCPRLSTWSPHLEATIGTVPVPGASTPGQEDSSVSQKTDFCCTSSVVRPPENYLLIRTEGTPALRCAASTGDPDSRHTAAAQDVLMAFREKM
ncbi:hypothetical protein VULLAG_LOCUS23553 [Vulpes lagopus]